MVGLTTAGGEECGALGDFLNWEEAEWTLRSQAKMIEVEMSWIEGPCRMRESEVQVFTANFKEHQECMQHCKKIVDGRSPAVTTEEEWENFKLEVDLITEDRSSLPYMWLSATKGDKDGKLAKLDHWPEAIVVNNETQKAIWRDFYSGQRLDNWAHGQSHIMRSEKTITQTIASQHTMMCHGTDLGFNGSAHRMTLAALAVTQLSLYSGCVAAVRP